MNKTTKANKNNTLEAVRIIMKDDSIKFGRRWEFEKDGKEYIARSSHESKSDNPLDFKTSYDGYDYTIAIRFEEIDFKFKINKH